MGYEQLTLPQFCLGFVKSIEMEKNVQHRGNMVSYFCNLLQNICDIGFGHAKEVHHVLLTQMEEGLVNGGQQKMEQD